MRAAYIHGLVIEIKLVRGYNIMDTIATDPVNFRCFSEVIMLSHKEENKPLLSNEKYIDV
jgi:hypothetical protein